MIALAPVARPGTVAGVLGAMVVAHVALVAWMALGGSSSDPLRAAAPSIVAVDVIGASPLDDAPILKRGSASGTDPGARGQRASHGAHAHAPHPIVQPSPTQQEAPSHDSQPTRESPEPSTHDETPQKEEQSHDPETPASSEPATSSSATGDPAPASSASTTTKGDEHGAEDGTETDPLKARAVDTYRRNLSAWFAARFDIRHKMPFEDLAKLHAEVVVQVDGARHVTGFTIVAPSGNAIFDDQLRHDLDGIRSSGVELPAPPSAYQDILRSTVNVGFSCTNRARCE